MMSRLKYWSEAGTYEEVRTAPGAPGPAGPTGPPGPPGPMPTDALQVIMVGTLLIGTMPPAGTRLKLWFGRWFAGTDANASAVMNMTPAGFQYGYIAFAMGGAPVDNHGNNIQATYAWSVPADLNTLRARMSKNTPGNLISVPNVTVNWLCIGA